jgi:hypothetical protein
MLRGAMRLVPHRVTTHVADIEREPKGRGHVHPESVPPVAPLTAEGRSRG